MERMKIRQKEKEKKESNRMEKEEGRKERGREKKAERVWFRRAARPFSQETPSK